MACAFVPRTCQGLVPVEPFMQAIHTLPSSWPASPSPQETLLSVLCTPQSSLPAALTFHGRYYEVPLQNILIPFLGENIQP